MERSPGIRDRGIVGELSTLYQPGAPDKPEPILILVATWLFNRGNYRGNAASDKYQPVNQECGIQGCEGLRAVISRNNPHLRPSLRATVRGKSFQPRRYNG